MLHTSPILVELHILKNMMLYKVVPIILAYRCVKDWQLGLALQMMLLLLKQGVCFIRYSRAETCIAGMGEGSEGWLVSMFHLYFFLVLSSRKRADIEIIQFFILMVLQT